MKAKKVLCFFTAAAVMGNLSGCSREAVHMTETQTLTEAPTLESETPESESETPDKPSEESEGMETENTPGESVGAEIESVVGKMEEEGKEMYRSYAEIVGRYQEAYEQVKNGGVPENIPEDMNFEFYAGASYPESAYSGFQLYDLNSDGTPELFIGTFAEGNTSDLFVYDVYTWAEGKRVRLMDDIGYRGGTCIICEGGFIKDLSSGSAVDSMEDYHRLPEGGTALELVESISAHGDIETGELHYYHAHDAEPDAEISEEEYFNMSNSYVEMKGITAFEATEEQIENLKNGNFNF